MAGAATNSDDEFQTISPPLSQKLVKRNQKIPVGHILASLKWRNTSVVQKMTGENVTFPVIFFSFSSNEPCCQTQNYREHQGFVCFRLGCCRFPSVRRLRSNLYFCSWHDRGPVVQKTTSWTEGCKLEKQTLFLTWCLLTSNQLNPLGERYQKSDCSWKDLLVCTAIFYPPAVCSSRTGTGPHSHHGK